MICMLRYQFYFDVSLTFIDQMLMLLLPIKVSRVLDMRAVRLPVLVSVCIRCAACAYLSVFAVMWCGVVWPYEYIHTRHFLLLRLGSPPTVRCPCLPLPRSFFFLLLLLLLLLR